MLNSEHQKLVDKANNAIFIDSKKVARDPYRLGYHLMAPANWMNDPNGLIQFKGEYHIFYQHNPFSPEWGPMHWGHAISKDLVHWEHMPIALAPSEEYDIGGCFSGCAVDDNGTLTLIYTGHVDGRDPKEVQCIATSIDGIHFTKYDKNPVINEVPVDGSQDFRDPKVWKYNNIWYMVVGSGKDGKGKVLLYRSQDLRKWDYIGPVAESDGNKGYMWECPNLFPLNDKHVLIISPIGMNGAKNIYITGEMDYKTGKFVEEYYEEIDYGDDFYAAQTFLDDKGRWILIGWMGMWNTKIPTKDNGWAGAMTIPRVITLLPGGKLSFQPVPELQKLRQDHYRFENLVITPTSYKVLGDLQGDRLEIIAEFKMDLYKDNEFGIKLRCSSDYSEETLVFYNTNSKELCVDRNKSGIGDVGVSRRRIDLSSKENLKIHIFLDCSSLEVFGNDGCVVMSNRIYPKPSSLGIDLFARNGSVNLISLDVWKLESIWGDE